jgi:ABC-type cobalt transport system substrate-binding protein
MWEPAWGRTEDSVFSFQFSVFSRPLGSGFGAGVDRWRRFRGMCFRPVRRRAGSHSRFRSSSPESGVGARLGANGVRSFQFSVFSFQQAPWAGVWCGVDRWWRFRGLCFRPVRRRAGSHSGTQRRWVVRVWEPACGRTESGAFSFQFSVFSFQQAPWAGVRAVSIGGGGFGGCASGRVRRQAGSHSRFRASSPESGVGARLGAKGSDRAGRRRRHEGVGKTVPPADQGCPGTTFRASP